MNFWSESNLGLPLSLHYFGGSNSTISFELAPPQRSNEEETGVQLKYIGKKAKVWLVYNSMHQNVCTYFWRQIDPKHHIYRNGIQKVLAGKMGPKDPKNGSSPFMANLRLRTGGARVRKNLNLGQKPKFDFTTSLFIYLSYILTHFIWIGCI